MSTEIVLYGFPLSVLIIGMVAVARLEGLPSTWAPGFSLLLGILGGEAAQAHIYQAGGRPDWVFGAIAGVGLGLLASGIYSHAQVYVSTGTVPRQDIPSPVESPAQTELAPTSAPTDTTAP